MFVLKSLWNRDQLCGRSDPKLINRSLQTAGVERFCGTLGGGFDSARARPAPELRLPPLLSEKRSLRARTQLSISSDQGNASLVRHSLERKLLHLQNLKKNHHNEPGTIHRPHNKYNVEHTSDVRVQSSGLDPNQMGRKQDGAYNSSRLCPWGSLLAAPVQDTAAAWNARAQDD